jgi:GntR family transcriptional regulator
VILDVDPHSPVPPYEQLRAQVSGLVATGALPAGTRLPSIRQLAGDLGLAPGTVARAYRELESAGVVVSRGRHGTEVVGPATAATAPHAPHAAHLDEAAAEFVAAAARSGSGVDQAVAAVRRAFERLGATASTTTPTPAHAVPTQPTATPPAQPRAPGGTR